MGFEYSEQKKDEKQNKTGIPDNMKKQFEAYSSLSFDDVKVHYNSPEPSRLNALAYTWGTQVYIAPGQAKHLPHELGHVVQQKKGIVPATTKINNIPINDNTYLEKEADDIGNNALGANLSNTMEKAYVSVKAPTIQRYTTFNQDGKVYNMSSTGKAICGLEYPNHELYVRDINDVVRTSDSALIILKKSGEKKIFNRLRSEYGRVEYEKVVPEWKENYNINKEKAIKSLFNWEDGGKSYTLNGMKITNERWRAFSDIRTNVETMRKYITVLYYKWSKTFPKEIFELYQNIYIELQDIFDRGGIINDDKISKLKRLREMFIYNFQSESHSITIFDNSSLIDDMAEMYDPIINCITILINGLTEISETEIKKNEMRLSFFLDMFATNDVLLPRGCDLVAGLFGREDDARPFLNFKVQNYDKDKHHFATIILTDLFDFITIEGFAKHGYENLDNTWEYYMHGHYRNSEEEAFNEYTRYRYSFFEDFRRGLPGQPNEEGTTYAGTQRVSAPSNCDILPEYILRDYC